MKILFKQRAAILSVCTAVLVSLSSFTEPAGGECFEIYQDGKMLVLRCGKDLDVVQTLNLASVSGNSDLTVKYFHCGTNGKSRTLTLKSSDGKILKEWKFADAEKNAAPMKCSTKEIMNVKIANASGLKLYYTSNELPGGRLLAIINTSGNSKTTNP